MEKRLHASLDFGLMGFEAAITAMTCRF